MFDRSVGRTGQEGRGTLPLTGRFLLRSAIAFLAIGVLADVVVGRQVEQHYQDFAEFHAEFVANSLLARELAWSGVLDGTANAADRADLQQFVADHVLVGDVLRLKVWSADGTIVVADDPDLVGAQSPAQAEHLTEILATGTVTEREETRTDGDLGAVKDTIETYVPIDVDGQPAVVEIYQDLGPTLAAGGTFARSLTIVLAVGLTGLWVLLIPIVRRAARRLEEQNDELERLLTQEKETVARLQELNEMKDTILSAVSHELRTPLTVLKTGSETLRAHGELLSPELRADLLERVGRNADRLETLLGSLLDLDRLMRGTVDARREPTVLAPLVGRVLEVTAPRRPLTVELDADVAVEVDAAQIERVVENLIYNAVRHTPDGVPVRIRSEVDSDAGRVVLVVADDGPGVPDKLKDAIFEPFTQGEVLHPESPGTGVGLALVRKFVELNGGRVWVEDAAGGGAAFRVELPLAESSPAVGAPRAELRASA